MTTHLSTYHGIFSSRLDTGAAKPPFSQLPAQIRRDLCTLVGAGDIIAATIPTGGVSASASFVLDFDTGQRVFAKGSHPGDQSHGAANLRGECTAYRTLDILRDVAPPFCGMVHADRGDDNGWWLGVWQAVDVMPAPYDVTALFALLDDIQNCDVPASTGLPVAMAHPYLAQFTNDVYKWQRLRDDASRAEKFAQCFADPPAARAWLTGEIENLCAMQGRASTHQWQLGVMHGDLRCDNVIYATLPAAPARWYVIDWANAADGPLMFDRVMLAASLLADGACDIAAACTLAQGRLSADDLRLMLVQQAGYFADQIYRAPPASMPRLRPMQKAMLAAMLAMMMHNGVVSAPLPDLLA